MKLHAFVRIHRSYVVNKKRVDKISANKVIINKIEILVGATYKSKLMNQFQLD